MKDRTLTVRVYGIYQNEKNDLLVSDEIIYGRYITKFPGGGLHFGEGTKECLEREMLEETGLIFLAGQHYYTTDFFVPSAFDPNVQVISIYYRISTMQEANLITHVKPFEFIDPVERAQSFRWIPLSLLKPDDLTLPIDRHVAEILLQK